MPKSIPSKSIPSCGCNDRCQCARELRCRCHDLNALLALALWDYSRVLRRSARR